MLECTTLLLYAYNKCILKTNYVVHAMSIGSRTIRTLDCSYRGLFVPPWTVRTMDCSYRPWSFRTLDYSYRGLFVPSWTVRTMDYSYHHWTIRTMSKVRIVHRWYG